MERSVIRDSATHTQCLSIVATSWNSIELEFYRTILKLRPTLGLRLLPCPTAHRAESLTPDYASLHPGYEPCHATPPPCPLWPTLPASPRRTPQASPPRSRREPRP